MLASVTTHTRDGKISFLLDIHIIDFQMEKICGFYSNLNDKEHNGPMMGRESLKLEIYLMSTGVTQWVTPDCYKERKTCTKNKLILGNLSDKHCSKWFICIIYLILLTTLWGGLLLWPSFTDEGPEAHQVKSLVPGQWWVLETLSQALTTLPGLSEPLRLLTGSKIWPTTRLVFKCGSDRLFWGFAAW